jgi:hypothetical protein
MKIFFSVTLVVILLVTAITNAACSSNNKTSVPDNPNPVKAIKYEEKAADPILGKYTYKNEYILLKINNKFEFYGRFWPWDEKDRLINGTWSIDKMGRLILAFSEGSGYATLKEGQIVDGSKIFKKQ